MMDNRTLRILEFHKVRERMAAHALSSLGKQDVLSMEPFADLSEADRELNVVDEAYRMVYRVGPPMFGGVTDIRSSLQKAVIGGILSVDELLAIANFATGGRAARSSILNFAESESIPLLQEAVEPLYDARRTEQEIRQAISEDATVVDHASPELRKIRGELRQLEGKSRQILEQLLRTHGRYLQESVIAMRGAHYCLAVRVDFKNQIRGIVRDYSSSGSTVFIEPQAVVEVSERIRSLQVDEEREIERILQRLSGAVALVEAEFMENVDILQKVDRWFTKGSYAKAEGALKPTLTKGTWDLVEARHPLIDRDQAVPMSAKLGESYRMLIVTGPNTGGKTVTLKTFGLLTILAMCGSFIPTRRESRVGFCQHIFADIGDEQSIEQSLSTFSSHMTNIVKMLHQIDDSTLVLLDELGAGTDPGEGSALAIALLDFMKERGASVVATTHYAELKGYAFNEPLAMNASVEFDVATLRPTYRLMVGVPGRSNALAIASRLGVPQEILNHAKSMVDSSDTRVEELIGKMEQATHQARLNQEESERHLNEVRSRETELSAKEERLQKAEERLEREARLEASEIVNKARVEAERIIREIRSMQNRAVKDHELVQLRKELEGALPDEPKVRVKRTAKGPEAELGSKVKVLSLGQKGEVVERSADGKSLVVQLGLLKMKVNANEVEVLREGPEPTVSAPAKRRTNVVSKDIRMELDVRGEMVDDALLRIDKYLDDAVMNGLARVVIIHGKGTGALRQGVRSHLRHHRQVVGMSPGGAGEGGDGVTVVAVRV